MPLATKNNALILKDGKLAENCGCCGGWYCYTESLCACLDKCCPASTLLLDLDFYAQPNIGPCPPGTFIDQRAVALFPMRVVASVLLTKQATLSGDAYRYAYSTSTLNALGVGEFGFFAGFDIACIDNTACKVTLTSMGMLWKWSPVTQTFIASDDCGEFTAEGYVQYQSAVVILRTQDSSCLGGWQLIRGSRDIQQIVSFNDSPGVRPLTFVLTGQGCLDAGAANGTVTLRPAS